MSKIVDKKLLDSGLFSQCSVHWSPKWNKFMKSDTAETMRCCILRCANDIELCHQVCDTRYNTKSDVKRCRDSCEIHKKMCGDTCKLIGGVWGRENPFVKCSEDIGCGKLESMDKKCLSDNREEILRCCKKRCFPTEDIDCEKHCQYSALLNVDLYKGFGIENSETLDSNLGMDIKNKYRDNTLIYVIIAVVLGILSVVTVFKMKEN